MPQAEIPAPVTPADQQLTRENATSAVENGGSGARSVQAPEGTGDSLEPLLQQHIARSAYLMRQAMELQRRAESEITEARAEAERQREAEQQRQREALSGISRELVQARSLLDRLLTRVDELRAPGPTTPSTPNAGHPNRDTAPGGPLPTHGPNDPVGDTPESPPPAATREPRTDSGSETTIRGPVFDQPTPPQPPTLPAEATQPEISNTGAVPITVLVHGVPRAAVALSLQRHLADLPGVDSVEAREYAEGVLRLSVVSRRPIRPKDLDSWPEGDKLESLTTRSDLVEVRLPPAPSAS